MWLHVPLPTSVYAQESQDLRLDSKQLSLLEQYATWKTKSASQRYWQNVWKNNHSLMKHLYGLICEPSTLILGVEEWISSQVASLVSRSQSPDTDSKKTTPEICGLTQPDLYGGLGHQLSFSKMFQESSNIISIQSDPNFVRWVTRLRKDYSQRQRQAHRTSDREFSSWPTPTVVEAEKIGNRPNYGQIALGNHPAIMGLPDREKMTKSRQNDNIASNPDSHYSHLVHQKEKSGTHSSKDILTSTPPFAQKGICSPKCRRLNPNFAEHLMGLPIGWTLVSDYEQLETQSFLRWQQTLSEYLVKPSPQNDSINEMWPTVTAQEFPHFDVEINEKNRRESKDGKTSHSLNLQDVSRIWSKDNWPTPRVSDTEGGIASNVEMSNGSFSRTNAKGVRWGVKLKDAVANWPAWSTDEDVSTDQEPVQLTF